MNVSNENGDPDAVAWQEWGDEAFAEAQRDNKPILLDIGAVWCHWCHVMDDGIAGDPDHTGTYSDPSVRALIASSFVPVKVDNDKRPDINARYNMGGWPSTVFLTPQGETLYGETYVPPRRMVALLEHIQKLWTEDRESVDAQLLEMRLSKARETAAVSSAALDSGIVPFVREALAQSWDREFGGFVTNRSYAPKFPHPSALCFALEQYARAPDDSLKEMIVSTLRGMSGGGMYDGYAGGFFRYSTTRDWSVPHYEKMLEDNAKLTSVYVLASNIFTEMPEFLETACHAQSWMLSDLRDSSTGAFAGSQDADAEGAYYGEPLTIRETLPTPYIDRTTYADWNSLTVSALVHRFQTTAEQPILQAAADNYRFLRTYLTETSGETDALLTLRHYAIGTHAEGTRGLLGDQVCFLNAALDLSETTQGDAYRSDALGLGDYLLTHLQDLDSGGFYDMPPNPEGIGELARPKKELDDNSEAALALLKLSVLTGNEKYREAGERALRFFAEDARQMSFFAASYARAVNAYTRPEMHIILVGRSGSEGLSQMQRLAWLAPIPGKYVETLGEDLAKERSFPPAPDGRARAYVCVGTSCQIAATEEALNALLSGSLQDKAVQGG